ncbi:HVO_0476 family zinc finger protein [Salinigranum salinum]|uniref:HVO_0476 family zinc finger protein n=1 Tax=Salinigranum salinum TaxID=1364937 RepID=UPI001260D1F2|nr:HVO_0476 family zinc finger protein [Salinigranum salinum]
MSTTPDTGERLPLACPSCSPGEPTVHEIVKPGGQSTVRCTECGHVRKERVEKPREIAVDVVVSQDGESLSTTVDAPAEERVEVGDEFIVDTPEALMQVRITAIEVGPERRVDEARMDDVETVWTRVVDNVTVNVTVHPNDGRRDESRSLKMQVPGDYEFTVGAVESVAGEEFEVDGIHVRADADGYRFDKFDHDGDVVFAKDVKRVYGRDTTTAAWSAW